MASAQQVLAPEPFLFRYQFREPLIEGVILRKRKRFTADVAIDGQVVVCHCPTTCLSLYQTLLDGQQVDTSSASQFKHSQSSSYCLRILHDRASSVAFISRHLNVRNKAALDACAAF